MTPLERKMLTDLRDRKLSPTEFHERFPLEQYYDKKHFATELDDAVARKDEEEIELLILLLWPLWRDHEYIDSLNKLILTPYHKRHQEIARKLQKIKSPTSIPFVRKALASNFDYLAYTCSESDVIAKWFSWILAEIGTKEALDLLEEYSHSTDEGIRSQMLYRLEKIKEKTSQDS
jgi:HEAT repeat protein